jgi:hypothetical protein
MFKKESSLKGSWEMKIRSGSEIGKEVPLMHREVCGAVPSWRLPVIPIIAS